MLIAAPLQNAIDELSKLPSIGKKTAQRLALFLLKADNESVTRLTGAISELKEKLVFCSICFNISTEEICPVCQSEKRDKSVMCVVEEASDIIAIEKTNEYNGVYHVLGGTLSPLRGVGADDIKLKEFINRIDKGSFKEIILALNPDTEGDTTSLYIARMLKDYDLKLTRIARGLPIGGDLEYADEATLGRAFLGRMNI